MGKQAYSVTHERDGNYRLHATEPTPRVIAKITAVIDRSAQIIGWKLKPLVVMQGAVSHLWPSPADAIAATKLLSAAKARTAVKTADTAHAATRTTNLFGEPL